MLHAYTFELYSSAFAQYSAYTAAGHTDHTPFVPIFGAHLVRTHRLDIMAGGAKVDKAPQKCRVDQWIMDGGCSGTRSLSVLPDVTPVSGRTLL